MKKSILFSIVIAGLFFSCSQPTRKPLDEAQKAAIADSVRQLSDSMWSSLLVLDLAGGLKYLSPDVAFAVPDSVFFSVKAIEEVYLPAFEKRATQTVAWKTDKLAVLAENVVVRVRTGDWTVTFKDGSTLAPHLNNTEVWQKKEGNWSIVNFHQAWK